jgi:hypothetical protein
MTQMKAWYQFRPAEIMLEAITASQLTHDAMYRGRTGGGTYRTCSN